MVTVIDAHNPEELTITGSGANIFVRIWRPEVPPVGIFAICHGLNAHSGQYSWVAEQMVAEGFAVYALDLRGRGRSGGERFYVEQIDEYVADLHALIRLAGEREGPLPVYLLGHSAGGVTACVYALEHPEELAGLICESFAFQVPAPDFALAILKGLSHVVPHAHVLALKNEDFSRDPAVLTRLNEDPLTKGESQPTKTVAALVRADERLKREFPLITLPVLILHGTADRATKPSGSQFFYDTAGSADKTLKFYEGHFHDLLSDIGRESVIKDIQNWIAARLPQGGASEPVA